MTTEIYRPRIYEIRSVGPTQKRTGLVRASGRQFVDNGGAFNPLGTSFFWGLWGWEFDRARVLQHFEWFAAHGLDYTRDFGQVGGISWEDRTIDPMSPGYTDRFKAYLDTKYGVYGIRTALTAFASESSDPNRAADNMISAIHGREESILYIETANEAIQNMTDHDTVRTICRKFRNAFGGLVATSSYDLEMMKNDFDVANLFIMHTERQQGDENWRQVRQPVDIYDFSTPGDNNEPPGLESSVAVLEDPLRLGMLRNVGITSGMSAFILHTGAGIRGGGKADLARGRKSNIWEYTAIEDIMLALHTAAQNIPIDAPNWRKVKGHWPDAPFIADMIWSDDPNRYDHGCVRVYGSYNGRQTVQNVLGIRHYVNMTSRGAWYIQIFDALTGQLMLQETLTDGQTFRIEGDPSGGSNKGAIILGSR